MTSAERRLLLLIANLLLRGMQMALAFLGVNFSDEIQDLQNAIKYVEEEAG